MQVALVGVHTLEYAELADLTWTQNKELYCKRHGFVGEDRLIPLELVSKWGNIAFDKMRLVLEYFDKGAEWVWATGTDSLITDFTNDLSSIIETKASFVVASDCNSVNADSFLVKNDVDGRRMINYILSREPTGAEQYAIGELFRLNNPGKVQMVPQRVLNSYNYDLYSRVGKDRLDQLGTDGHWQYGDLLIHWPGFGSEPQRRCEWARQYMNQIKL